MVGFTSDLQATMACKRESASANGPLPTICSQPAIAREDNSGVKQDCRPPTHVYEIRPRRDKRGVDLISAVLPFGRLWYADPDPISNAIGYAKHRNRSHDAVICVYDAAGNVIETHELYFTRSAILWAFCPNRIANSSAR